MRGGFSFCGHDIADYNIHYAPDNENTYVYRPAKSNVHEETFEGHDGGYIYGASRQPKEFILRCYYEDTQIDRGLMARVHQLFKIGRSGQLIFARRPWCAYYATVTDVDDKSMYSYLNGLITITMKAGYPFARGINVSEPYEDEHLFYSIPKDPYHDQVMLNTGMFEKSEMVPNHVLQNIVLQNPNTRTIYLPNPGTERASVGIVAAGNAGTGVIITNNTTGQTCKLIGLSKAITTNANKEVFVDGISGKTVLRNNVSSEISFLYHDEGFIELEPNFPIIRNVFATTDGTNRITLTNRIEEEVIGKFIYADGAWRKIVNQTDIHTLIVNPVPSHSVSERTCISSMNEIVISAVSSIDLDRLSFIYKPTYS